jgi:hypothetical protein
LIAIWDVPVRWHCQDLRRDVRVLHVTGPPSQSGDGQSPIGEWSYPELSARLEPYFSKAHRSPECRRLCAELLETLDNLREIDGEQQESKDPSDVGPLRDPPRLMIPRRPEAHPARRSPLARRMGSTNWKGGSSQSGQPKRWKVYVCRICKQQGHNAKTCRAIIKWVQHIILVFPGMGMDEEQVAMAGIEASSQLTRFRSVNTSCGGYVED